MSEDNHAKTPQHESNHLGKKILGGAAVVGGLMAGASGPVALESCNKTLTDTTYANNNGNNQHGGGTTTPVDSTTIVESINVSPSGDTTYHYYGGGTSTARRVGVYAGEYAIDLHDPQGDMDAVHKLEFYNIAVCRLGYQDIVSNHSSNVKTTPPNNLVGWVDISNIQSNDGYFSDLYNQIAAIPNGFITSSAYPGYHIPNFALPAVKSAFNTRMAEIANDPAVKGLQFVGLDNIANVSNLTSSSALIDSTLASLGTVGSELKGQSKNFIIGGGLYNNNYVQLASKVGQMTNEIYLPVSVTPIPASPTDVRQFDINQLRDAVNGANQDLKVYTSIAMPSLDTGHMHAAARDLRDNVGKASRQGTNTLNFYQYCVTDPNFTTPSDVVANTIDQGSIAFNDPITTVPCDLNKVNMYNSASRSFEAPVLAAVAPAAVVKEAANTAASHASHAQQEKNANVIGNLRNRHHVPDNQHETPANLVEEADLKDRVQHAADRMVG